MLESLRIHNIALIEDITIHFHRGMQVLTGETGAGKSIVVDSVNLILGGRAEKDMIRSGCDKASVEAIFQIHDNKSIKMFMDNEGIDYDGQTVTVCREISTEGRNICRICGVILPVSRLKELSQFLMDIHGQNEHQFLADQEKQLLFLDQTGGAEHRKIITRTQDACERFMHNHRTYAKMVRENQNREEKLHSLENELSELRKAKVNPGEAAELTEKRKLLTEAEKKRNALNNIRECFFGTDENDSCIARMRKASEDMKALSARDGSIKTISGQFESLYLEIEEVAYQVSVMADRAEIDPAEPEKIDNRLEQIHHLERKYNIDADEIPALLEKKEKEYSYLSELEDEISRMAADHKKLLSEYRAVSRELTESRKALASEFENNMMKELRDLGMGNTRFCVEFKLNETGKPLMPSLQGDDRIEFLISPNPGEPLKPMAKIASGGELSRLMLAVKTLESVRTGVESMVFDEIDTGISGRMAQVVAEKMIDISRQRQVICVTHLPQIAATADFHYLVQKGVSEGRTNTVIDELDREGRREEISRMISGADGITEQTNIYASEMIQSADAKKQR